MATRSHSTETLIQVLSAGVLAIAVGLLIPLAQGALFVGVLAICFAPIALVLINRPQWLFASFVFVQILEGFQIASPAGSISVGLVLLAMLVLRYATDVLESFENSRALRVWLALMLIWIFSIALHTTYQDAQDALRSSITASSFLVIGLLAAAMVKDRQSIPSAAFGAAAGLLTLGVLGVLAARGYIPLPARNELPRTLYGITMPIRRNYGLNVGFDSTALLAPIAVAYFAVKKGFTNKLVLAALFVVFLVVFQARGMAIQVLLALMIAPVLVRPRRALLIVPVALVVFAGATITASDQRSDLSAASRTTVDVRVLRDVRDNPGSFLLGRDETAYFRAALAGGHSGLLPAFRKFKITPVHNYFLGNLISGGWLSLFALSAIFIVMLWVATRRFLADRSDWQSQVLLIAAILITFEAFVEPIAANVAGLWLVMGFVFGRGIIPRKQSAQRKHVTTAH